MRVATDGACLGNPGPCGWAWVGDDGTWAAGSPGYGTNNVGELLGLTRALTDHADIPDLTIEIDSQYALNMALDWGPAARARGLRNSTGKPTANPELIGSLLDAIDARTAAGLPAADMVWVKGHSTHTLNTWADNRATGAARKGRGEWGTHLGGQVLNVSAPAPAGQADHPGDARGGGRWATQTEIGQRLGLTAIQVGHALDTAGLRDPHTKHPTAAGMRISQKRTSRGRVFFVWDREKAVHALRA